MKLASELRRESLDKFMIDAAKERLTVLKMRQSGIPENEWKERRDFDRRKKEVEEKWEVLEKRCNALRKSEKELSEA
jgi:hypothetical protein